MIYPAGVVWPFRKQKPENLISISDPVLAEFFSVGPTNLAGVSVNEGTALGLSAVWRSVALISQSIASLPMRTLRDDAAGKRERVGSFLDNPGGPGGPTRFEWLETVLAHLLLHGNAFLAHLFNGGGQVIGLVPIHPLAVSIEAESVPGGKRFKVTLDPNVNPRLDAGPLVRTFTTATMTHIPALSLDGLRGLSPISVARNSLGTAIAGDRAAARQFGNGAMVAGLVTPEEDITEAEAKVIKEGLRSKLTGVDNAGDVAVINRKLKFTPWTMSNEDAQFLQSRQFSIEEIARWWGIPPFALMQTEKQTSWGTGIEAQQRGLARGPLLAWTTRIEQRLTRLLLGGRFVEFDFTALERPTPETEIELLIKQVDAGLLTINEARRIRNMDRIDGGDVLRTRSTVPGQPPQPPAEEEPEDDQED